MNWPAQTGDALRREFSVRALEFARKNRLLHVVSDGSSPSVLFGRDEQGKHGNFHPASYRRICANGEWAARLNKVHTASRRMRVRTDWRWMELDCAHSSDALLMNVFCYPAVFRDGTLAQLLGVDRSVSPVFGYLPGILLKRQHVDRTEVDMKLGSLMVEAKLTEAGFQTASLAELLRYRDFSQVFDVNALPRRNNRFAGYQVIRGILAAHASNEDFCLICDGRRHDLIEIWYQVIQAARFAEMRCRVKLATWQEIIDAVPKPLRCYITGKYGIASLPSC